MPRIVGGRHRGRTLQAPEGRAVIRPTSERAREALFDILGHRDLRGDGEAAVRDRHVADLCCGIGALGLEALSRGAASAVFIDRDRASVAIARANAAKLGEERNCRFAAADLGRPETVAAALRSDRPFDLVLLDPPYDAPAVAEAILAGLVRSGRLASPALVTVELARGTDIVLPEALRLLDRRRYGKADLLILGHEVGDENEDQDAGDLGTAD
ncbi:RsmD family RNA methyltransferase [Tistrella mobilis]|uniref:RsmD family RNA methyltransferase n=1 Tax=Tistrella mobilis TaxID=171437 RepID=UPI0031F60EA8